MKMFALLRVSTLFMRARAASSIGITTIQHRPGTWRHTRPAVERRTLARQDVGEEQIQHHLYIIHTRSNWHTMGRRRLFLPAQVSSIQFARDVNCLIFAEAERLVSCCCYDDKNTNYLIMLDFQKRMQRVWSSPPVVCKWTPAKRWLLVDSVIGIFPQDGDPVSWSMEMMMKLITLLIDEIFCR